MTWRPCCFRWRAFVHSRHAIGPCPHPVRRQHKKGGPAFGPCVPVRRRGAVKVFEYGRCRFGISVCTMCSLNINGMGFGLGLLAAFFSTGAVLFRRGERAPAWLWGLNLAALALCALQRGPWPVWRCWRFSVPRWCGCRAQRRHAPARGHAGLGAYAAGRVQRAVCGLFRRARAPASISACSARWKILFHQFYRPYPGQMAGAFGRGGACVHAGAGRYCYAPAAMPLARWRRARCSAHLPPAGRKADAVRRAAGRLCCVFLFDHGP